MLDILKCTSFLLEIEKGMYSFCNLSDLGDTIANALNIISNYLIFLFLGKERISGIALSDTSVAYV